MQVDNEQTQLKEKTIFGLFWKFAERFMAQIVSLVVSVILARLLTPDDYGVVGIVTIFFAFANVFISGGFNTALIQKKDADQEDYSSVLWISLITAAILYSIMFFCAPSIASAYDKAILIPVVRVMGLTIFINAFKSVACAYISSHFQFRKFFFATIGGTLVSAVVGIVMALKGYGAWALVAQQMTNSIVDTLILYLTTRIRFVFRICKQRTKRLFNYSWKILAASGISVVYDEVNPLIIGLKYSSAHLSYYSKGKSFPSLINSTIGNTLSAVLFPAMAKVQDNKEAVLNYTRKFMRVTSFVLFPMMLGFLVVAEKFILLLLTDKWISATFFLQAFCIVYMFDMIQSGNLQVIRAVGRSDILLILEIVKKTTYAIVIALFVFFTNKPEYLALACIINTGVATLVNTFPNRKLIGYKYRLQVLDLLPNFIIAAIMGAVVYCVGLLKINLLLLFALQIVSGFFTYILLSVITKNENLQYVLEIIRKFLKKGKKQDEKN